MYDPHKHHRRSIRLKGYDYTQEGMYFITICVQGGRCLLGQIQDGEMRPNPAGKMVQQTWDALPKRFPQVDTDAFVIMPNHIHGILAIREPLVGVGLVPTQNVPNQNMPAQDATEEATTAGRDSAEQATGNRVTTRVTPTLGQIVGAMKSITTHQYTQGVHGLGWVPFEQRFWQRNYYEHIIRNETELSATRRYTRDNPANWHEDQENQPGLRM
jgi:REP element-mobilizing transposase RayT